MLQELTLLKKLQSEVPGSNVEIGFGMHRGKFVFSGRKQVRIIYKKWTGLTSQG